ncbi:hypothetical protein F2Q70_00017425 [Brassica cretica]|uniref:Uncharacterized protein n=1 Tax=Brassica cretica TaxID=69181 RepID=A0A3N6RWK7_BRACR|nr:hypothetical protein F2Q70_00017425 [Brassica cretica]KAF2596787.1 hypothetical protein F2Q68_00010387 [Brassica cretica]
MFGSAHQVLGVEIWMGVKAGSLHYLFPARYQEEVTDELARLCEMPGVDIDAGPSSHKIIAACQRCGVWSWDDRMRLGYLAIYT